MDASEFTIELQKLLDEIKLVARKADLRSGELLAIIERMNKMSGLIERGLYAMRIELGRVSL